MEALFCGGVGVGAARNNGVGSGIIRSDKSSEVCTEEVAEIVSSSATKYC